MPTFNNVAQDVLENLGVYAAGEIISDADVERLFIIGNDMLDSWANESLTCFELQEQSFPINPGQASYTIGIGAQINLPRPIRINEGPGSAYFQDSNGNNYDCEVVTRVAWNWIGNRTLAVNSNIPSKLFYDPQMPFGVINLFPFPTGGLSLTCFFDSFQPLTQFPDLVTNITFPPGYSLAIKKNLALFAGPYFKPEGWTPSPELKQQALEAKANVKRSNTRNNPIAYDPELLPRAASTYNVYSDRA